jgi:hypothetical protein
MLTLFTMSEAIGNGLGDESLIPSKGKKRNDFSLQYISRLSMGPNQPPIQ